MRSPAFVVLTEPDVLDGLGEALDRRYGREYEIVCESSAEAGVAQLGRLVESGRQVAVVFTPVSMIDSGFLPAARGLFPFAKRVVFVPQDLPAAPSLRVPNLLLLDSWIAQTVLRAMSLGTVDTYLPSPSGPHDEGFHLGISELLDDWSREVGLDHPAAQIIGARHHPRTTQLRDILARNNIPFEFVPAESDRGKLPPVVITYAGQVLSDPANDELAAAFGLPGLPAEMIDVAIVGAGPAGMSTAVYTASEGLSTLLLEREAFGGQAGSSSLIRNYLGFPRGVSGRNLASRAFAQVWAFGARAVMADPVNRLDANRDGDGYVLTFTDGSLVRCRSVVIATGATYRRLKVPGLEALTGAGVYYGAAASEAPAMAGQHVFIAGGANSAGQAAIHLARHASRVTLLVRRDSVAATMSRYLIDQIDGTGNIDIRHHTEVSGAGGDSRLESLLLRDNRTGDTETFAASALFVMIGADPHTGWLPGTIQRDDHGFVLTGEDLTGWRLPRPPLAFETSMPGVFAAGDVRHGSVKRVASAVGEGSIVTAQIYQFLAQF